MDCICGTVDFHKTPDLNNIFRITKGSFFSIFADERVLLCRLYDCFPTNSRFFADEKTAIVSIGEPFSENCSYVAFDKQKEHVRIYTTAEHPLFYVFSGTELVFSTTPYALEGILPSKRGLPQNITQIKDGQCGVFSRKGLSFY